MVVAVISQPAEHLYPDILEQLAWGPSNPDQWTCLISQEQQASGRSGTLRRGARASFVTRAALSNLVVRTTSQRMQLQLLHILLLIYFNLPDFPLKTS